MTERDGPPETPDVIDQVDRLIAELQGHADPAVAGRVDALLGGIDAIHRTALTHLIEAIRGMAGDAFINRLIADPAIRLLFMSYDLVAVDRRILAEEALDPIRGPLHDRGIDVEITKVVGGVVYVRLHGLDAVGMSETEVIAQLEVQLGESLPGFQQLVPEGRSQHGATHLIAMQALRGARRPVYRAIAKAAEVREKELQAIDVEGLSVLLTRVGDDVIAVRNRCGDTPLPLQFSRIDGAELHCSWHGCRYDMRTGRRLDREGERLQVFPVSVTDGDVTIAIDVEPNR